MEDFKGHLEVLGFERDVPIRGVWLYNKEIGNYHYYIQIEYMYTSIMMIDIKTDEEISEVEFKNAHKAIKYLTRQIKIDNILND